MGSQVMPAAERAKVVTQLIGAWAKAGEPPPTESLIRTAIVAAEIEVRASIVAPWFAWDAEYPDEGAIVIDVATQAEAEARYREEFDGDAEMPVIAQRVTAEDIAKIQVEIEAQTERAAAAEQRVRELEGWLGNAKWRLGLALAEGVGAEEARAEIEDVRDGLCILLTPTQPEDDRPASEDELSCGARGGDRGYYCTRPADHAGAHVAHVADDKVAARWPAAPPEATAETEAILGELAEEPLPDFDTYPAAPAAEKDQVA